MSGRTALRSLENAGLTVVQAESLEALTAEHAGNAEGPNVVRMAVRKHPNVDHPDVVVRPTWVHWIASAADGSEGVIAGQGQRQRHRSRHALRGLDALELRVSEPVDADVFDTWAQIYRARTDRPQDGEDLASALRPHVLAPGSPFVLATWHDRDGGALAGGCLIRIDPGRSALVGALSASASPGTDMARAMYLATADLAASRGLRWVTLGRDVNFYGAALSPGLCTFKLRLGFTPVPAEFFGLNASRDIAERLVSLEGLHPPVLRFAYGRPRVAGLTAEDFLTGPHALRLVSAG